MIHLPLSADDQARLIKCADDQIRRGLPDGSDRRKQAQLNQESYDLQGIKQLPARPNEGWVDYYNRIKSSLPIVKRTTDVLTEDLYSPGPSRQLLVDGVVDQELTDWFNKVAADNHLNAQCQNLDKISHLNWVASLQVAATGDPEHPIRLNAWNSKDFEVILHPDDPCCPVGMITIEELPDRFRWKLWTKDLIRTYEKVKPGKLHVPGFNDPSPVGPDEANPYGVLPFAYFWHEMPFMSFWQTPLGNYLRQMQVVIDQHVSSAGLALERFGMARGVAYNAEPGFTVIDKPGEFLKVPPPLAVAGYEPNPQVRLEFLSTQVQIDPAWSHIRKTIEEVLSGLGIPLTIARAETANIVSGVAMLVESEPLIRMTRNRRPAWQCYEQNLARTCCQVAGAYYNNPALLAKAQRLTLVLDWPETFDPMGPDKDEQDEREMASGKTSLFMVLQKRHGMTREQAVEHVAQVHRDNLELAAIVGAKPAGPDQDTDTETETDTEQEQEEQDREPGASGLDREQEEAQETETEVER